MSLQTSSLRVLLAVVRATAGASRMRASLLVLTATLACAHGKRGGVRQRNRRADAVEAATAAEAVEAATAADAGEVVDPLGYYRYRWQEPTDTCGTELHADYDGTRAWNWGLARRRVDMYAAHRRTGLRSDGRSRVEDVPLAQGRSRCLRLGLACRTCVYRVCTVCVPCVYLCHNRTGASTLTPPPRAAARSKRHPAAPVRVGSPPRRSRGPLLSRVPGCPPWACREAQVERGPVGERHRYRERHR